MATHNVIRFKIDKIKQINEYFLLLFECFHVDGNTVKQTKNGKHGRINSSLEVSDSTGSNSVFIASKFKLFRCQLQCSLLQQQKKRNLIYNDIYV